MLFGEILALVGPAHARTPPLVALDKFVAGAVHFAHVLHFPSGLPHAYTLPYTALCTQASYTQRYVHPLFYGIYCSV